MPLGDPEGGNFEYTYEGLPETLFACAVPVADMEKFDLFTRSASVADASIGQNSVNIQYNRADAPGFLMQGHESVSLSSEEVRRRPDAGCSLHRRAPSPDSDALP